MNKWQLVVNDLLDSGLSRQEIAEKCECSVWTIDKIKYGHRGKNLSYQIAVSLNQLHKEVLPCKALPS